MWKQTSGSLITWFTKTSTPATVRLCALMLLVSAQVSVTTGALPVFVETETNITASVGSEVMLSCGVRHLATYQVMWLRTHGPRSLPLAVGETMFMDIPSIRVEHTKVKDADMYNIVIENVSVDHGGRYACAVTAPERLSRNVTLNVVDALDGNVAQHTEAEITLTGNTTITEGDSIKLACSITGDGVRPSNVDWFKDDLVIRDDVTRGVRVVTSIVQATRALQSVLMIAASSQEDTGRYVCREGRTSLVDSLAVTVLTKPNRGKEPAGTTSASDRSGQHDPGSGGADGLLAKSRAIINSYTIVVLAIWLLN